MNQIYDILSAARNARRSLINLLDEVIADTLRNVADALVASTSVILSANAEDLSLLNPTDPRYDRLKLTETRIADIASDMRNVAALPDPRRVLERRQLPNGLILRKIAEPFGVVGVIYEARPNVSADVFSLCFKSHNACVLKGGHEADKSNRAIVDVIRHTLASCGIEPDVVNLLPPERSATAALLEARGLVDLIIPRGSKHLIDYVRDNARVPVIETGAGVCHCYVDVDADTDMARNIVVNAKTRRVSVCNALDCLIIARQRLADLSVICAPMADKNVAIHADDDAFAALDGKYPARLLFHAKDDDFGTEFLSYAMAVKTVDGIQQALEHIDRYGSGHSESIVTQNRATADLFLALVDAACVYHNAPTSFTDGAQFGLGAEIGISTQKLHARGPMALAELMTYKWLIEGNGQTRP